MTATLTPPEQTTQKVVLDDISWDTYQRLVTERGEKPQPRYSYDRGRLEIMVTSYEHESLKHDITALIEVLAEELDFDLAPAGSTTFGREDLSQAFEPDASFYIGEAPNIRSKKKIDLAVDPPPELVIEVDIASPSLNKFPIFASVGVTEVWRYHKAKLTIHVLDMGAYPERPASCVIPGATSADLNRLIAEGRTLRRAAWLRNVRRWATTIKQNY